MKRLHPKNLSLSSFMTLLLFLLLCFVSCNWYLDQTKSSKELARAKQKVNEVKETENNLFRQAIAGDSAKAPAPQSDSVHPWKETTIAFLDSAAGAMDKGIQKIMDDPADNTTAAPEKDLIIAAQKRIIDSLTDVCMSYAERQPPAPERQDDYREPADLPAIPKTTYALQQSYRIGKKDMQPLPRLKFTLQAGYAHGLLHSLTNNAQLILRTYIGGHASINTGGFYNFDTRKIGVTASGNLDLFSYEMKPKIKPVPHD